MMQEVEGLELLAGEKSHYIDGFVSTDPEELKGYLEELGYREPGTKGRQLFEQLYKEYLIKDEPEGLRHACAKNPKTDIEVSYGTIPISQVVEDKANFGFVPMSRLRIYTNGARGIESILFPLLRKFDERYCSVAFVSEDNKLFRKNWST